MFTVNASTLVKRGEIQKHPAAWLFRAYLRGRKPSLILAFDWLVSGEGMLLSLQQDLQPKPAPKPRKLTEPAYLPPAWQQLDGRQEAMKGHKA